MTAPGDLRLAAVFKPGKTPARAGAMKLAFARYADMAVLRRHHAAALRAPADFGHEGLVAQRDWGTLGNDLYGCCVWAGAGHEERVWGYEGGTPASISAASTLANYAQLTGFDVARTDANGDNPTDGGTDMQKAAEYRRTTGLLDARGNRLKIEAYLALEPGNLDELAIATWLFSAAGVGLEMRACFMDQFDAGKPWDVSTAPGAMKRVGGHYVSCLARRHGLAAKAEDFVVVTYGRAWPITPRALIEANDESVAYLTRRNLVAGRSPEGFDYAALRADLAALEPAA